MYTPRENNTFIGRTILKEVSFIFYQRFYIGHKLCLVQTYEFFLLRRNIFYINLAFFSLCLRCMYLSLHFEYINCWILTLLTNLTKFLVSSQPTKSPSGYTKSREKTLTSNKNSQSLFDF